MKKHVWKKVLGVILCTTMILVMSPNVFVKGIDTVSSVEDQTLDGIATINGTVKGVLSDDVSSASMVLYSAVNSYSVGIDEDGKYTFSNIPYGDYFLKIEIDGYYVFSPIDVKVDSKVVECPEQTVTEYTSSDYFYHWKADSSFFGYEEQANIVQPISVTFEDQSIYISDSAASIKLKNNYNVFLVDSEVKWTSDYASRLMDLYEEIPMEGTRKPSLWTITDKHVDNNVEIKYGTTGDAVLVSIDAFQNAVPKLANVDGSKGIYFSNALFDVIVRYITHDGTDIDAVDYILRTRFGCSVIVPDYEALTRGITNETAAAFEMFKPEELLSIINMFEEMPVGFHKVDGLDYLVRRIDGSRNPIYPLAAAVSWIYADPGYIEFIDVAFLGDKIYDTFRLVLHEKTHFLWHNVFNSDIKNEWARIGGWFEDPTVESGWSTTKQTEFVTAYSHDINPDEDMAESVAYYILDPNRLKARAPEKYDFIRNYIMNGEIYIATVREDLTFEVYNLYPDYAFPGRIVEFSVDIEGAPEEDKLVTFTIKLDTNGDEKFGSAGAFMRITSTKCTQSYDTYFQPVNEDNSVLQATLTMSRYSAAGYWGCTSLSLWDNVGNERFSNKNNFGWKLYINNPLEDLEYPEFVEDSIVVTQRTEDIGNGHTITYVKIEAEATDNIGIKPFNGFYTEIANNTHDSYRMDKWGGYNPETGKCEVTYEFSEYYHSGEYSINHIAFVDYAGNMTRYNFFSDGSGAKSYTTFEYYSDKSDYEAPQLDVNRIKVSAVPTHPEAPNGETLVTIKVFIKDDFSGFDLGSFTLVDPQGNHFFDYFYSENYYAPYFIGDPTVWKEYTITKILPEGSAPGIWSLQEISVRDRGGNEYTYNFLEIIHFIKMDGEGELTVPIEETNDSVKYAMVDYQYTIIDANITQTETFHVKRMLDKLPIVAVGEGAFDNTSLKSIVFESQNTVIYDSPDTIDEETKIVGYTGSTAEEYAIKYGREFESLGVLGDIDGKIGITEDDAIFLLYSTFFPDEFSVEQCCDFDANGVIDEDDAVYLLFYTFFPEEYPLT